MLNVRHFHNLSISSTQSTNMLGVLTTEPIAIGTKVYIGPSPYYVVRVEIMKLSYFPASGRLTMRGNTCSRHFDTNNSTFLERLGYRSRQDLINQLFSTGVPISLHMERTAYLHAFHDDFRLSQ